MQIIRPEIVTDNVLVSSNVPETVAVYAAGTTYAKLAIVRRESDHGLYESQIDGNVGQSLDDPTKWLRIGPTNRWAMFDDYNQTQTVFADSIDIALQAAGRVTGMAFLNVDAATIHVKMTDATAGVIHDETYSLVDNIKILNWYDWFFESIVQRTDLYVDDLPVHFASAIDIKISKLGSDAAIGNFIMGQVITLGGTLTGATSGIIDYSRKDADDFGNVNIIERSYRKNGSFEFIFEDRLLDNNQRILTELRATPVVYVGSDRYSAHVYYGFYRNFSFSAEGPCISRGTIEVEGLT